ncbi:hypothetical protein Lalb_Chr19g0132481 [Lupinus albus]|uniref:Uncharacterized protein n=1 Tax=Lupinus albus TaxID=3870 RepID=A0A6A4NGE8_LUPAL|nr:hypothetical protein Lalb_Chr19g0132481 [Lupinus albus]
MVRDVKSINNWGEVAPILLISNHRKSISSFKLLDPIMEEEPQGFELLHKGLLASFPLLLSGFLYIFLYRDLF